MNEWSDSDKGSHLALSNGGLTVLYSGPGRGKNSGNEHASSVRAKKPANAAAEAGNVQLSDIYYYEVCIVSAGRNGEIGVGFSTGSSGTLERMPGWEPGSCGYHGDNGGVYFESGRGKEWGPHFRSGDVIGCGLRAEQGLVFYTRNGTYLGVPFYKLPSGEGGAADAAAAAVAAAPEPNKLYPTVGMTSIGSEVEANFGGRGFAFDVRGFFGAMGAADVMSSRLGLGSPLANAKRAWNVVAVGKSEARQARQQRPYKAKWLEDMVKRNIATELHLRFFENGSVIGNGGRKQKTLFEVVGKWSTDGNIAFSVCDRLRKLQGRSAVEFHGSFFTHWGKISGTLFDFQVEMTLSETSRPMGGELSAGDDEAAESYTDNPFVQNLVHYCKATAGKPHQESLFDFKIISRDGLEIPAHKIVLASQSKYFEAQFRMENVDVSHLDFAHEAIEKCVRFVYGNKIAICDSNVQDFLEVADFLGMDVLVQQCKSFICDKMDADNCVDILNMSMRLQNDHMTRSSVDFVARNFSEICGHGSNTVLNFREESLMAVLKSSQLIVRNKQGAIVSGHLREYHLIPYIYEFATSRNVSMATFRRALRFKGIDKEVFLAMDIAKKGEILKHLTENMPVEACLFEAAAASAPTDGGDEATKAAAAAAANKAADVPRTLCKERGVWRGSADSHGNDFEFTFDDEQRNGKIIKAIHIFTRFWKHAVIVKGLKLIFSDGSILRAADTGPFLEEIVVRLDEDEHIMYAYQRIEEQISQLSFVSNKRGLLGPFGGGGGGPISCPLFKVPKEVDSNTSVRWSGVKGEIDVLGGFPTIRSLSSKLTYVYDDDASALSSSAAGATSAASDEHENDDDSDRSSDESDEGGEDDDDDDADDDEEYYSDY